MGERYIVIDRSESAHCCFTSTVVDTTKPTMVYGPPGAETQHYESVCECFDQADAERIAIALNAAAASIGRNGGDGEVGNG